jgi:DNA helicase-2/ATP-dependent DNA helicase PcrA
VPENLIDETGDRRRKQAMKYDGRSYDTVDAVMKVLGGGASRPAPPRPSGPPMAKPGPGKKSPGGWALGTRVKHPKYGYGTILRTEGAGEDLKLTISFISYGLKKMIAKYAELEIA